MPQLLREKSGKSQGTIRESDTNGPEATLNTNLADLPASSENLTRAMLLPDMSIGKCVQKNVSKIKIQKAFIPNLMKQGSQIIKKLGKEYSEIMRVISQNDLRRACENFGKP
jgi:hypothetical protein